MRSDIHESRNILDNIYESISVSDASGEQVLDLFFNYFGTRLLAKKEFLEFIVDEGYPYTADENEY